MLMETFGLNGKLKTDRMVQVLLKQPNKPDPGCKLSPVQVLLGRNLKNSLPCVRKGVMTFNTQRSQKCGLTYGVKIKNLIVFVMLSHSKV